MRRSYAAAVVVTNSAFIPLIASALSRTWPLAEQMDDSGERFVLVGRNVAHRLNDIAESEGSGLGTSHRMCLLASLSARRSALRSGVWSRVSI